MPLQNGRIFRHVHRAECVLDPVRQDAADGVFETRLIFGLRQFRHDDVGILRNMRPQGSDDHVHEEGVSLAGHAGLGPLRKRGAHLLLDVVQKGVERPLDHWPETLALPF